ncbi:MAG: hypothetical protein ACRC28_08505 [Clostridium sp.]|uniref:hypothetical protein n=1 Tax=Clostridium sp. TaxID=1506 RepID=UPI003F33F26B
MMNYKNTTRLDTLCMPTDVTDFTQITEDFKVCIPNSMPAILEIIDDKISIEISEKRVVSSPIGTSAEGYSLTGNTLIVIVDIKVSFQYVSGINNATVHSFSSLYSTIIPISLSKTFNNSFDVNANIFIEDLYYTVETEDSVFTSVTFLVTAEQLIGGC